MNDLIQSETTQGISKNLILRSRFLRLFLGCLAARVVTNHTVRKNGRYGLISVYDLSTNLIWVWSRKIIQDLIIWCLTWDARLRSRSTLILADSIYLINEHFSANEVKLRFALPTHVIHIVRHDLFTTTRVSFGIMVSIFNLPDDKINVQQIIR